MTDQEELALRRKVDRFEKALRKIARWHGEFPPSGRYFPVTTNGELTEMSYGAAFGSNGERDYMRQIALNALNGDKNDAR